MSLADMETADPEQKRTARNSNSSQKKEPNKLSNMDNQKEGDYRAISKTAVLSLVFAIFAFAVVTLVFVAPEVAMMSGTIAIFGCLFGGYALYNINRYPDELLGAKPAKIGFIGSIVLLIGSFGFWGYVYSTEVPKDHQRISFSMLKPDKRKQEKFAAVAEELDGKKVFIKGFVRPSDRKTGLEKFLLVGDFGDCCFGGNPKITDVVAIDLENGLTADYSFRVRRIAGTFRLNRDRRPVNEDGVPQVVYSIEADYIK